MESSRKSLRTDGRAEESKRKLQSGSGQRLGEERATASVGPDTAFRPSRLARVKRRGEDPDLQLKDPVGGSRRRRRRERGCREDIHYVLHPPHLLDVASSDWISSSSVSQDKTKDCLTDKVRVCSL